EAKLMPYLHLPVQSGSDRILKAMARKHTAEQYLRLVEKIRAARPDMMLSGDFIVGFPGETDADFDATLDLIRAVNYGMAYSFKYSARPGTPAAEKAPVPAEVADARLQVLQALIAEQQRAAQAAMVGRVVSVLFEKPGRLAGQMVGKSEYLHAVHVPCDRPVGTVAPDKIVASAPNSLAGEIPAAPVPRGRIAAHGIEWQTDADRPQPAGSCRGMRNNARATTTIACVRSLCHAPFIHNPSATETCLGISALTPPPRPEDLHETLLEFPNNRLLIDLCGEFDRNLAQIEHQLGVHILRRGNHLAVVGGAEGRGRAAAVLQTL